MPSIPTDLVKKGFDLALTVNRDEAKREIAELKKKYSGKSKRALAKKIRSRARWYATGSGFITGLPGNPWTMVPSAVADVGLVLRVEVTMACRIALLYDPKFLDDDEPPYEILVPIFGVRILGEALSQAGVKAGAAVTKQLIKKHISKGALKAVQKVALKYFGIKVTQKAIISKSLPIVGGLIGGGWNYTELSLVGGRVISYFEGNAVGKTK